MNYRHAYHAGGFADVFKHIVLVALVEALIRKDTAFCLLDTHAGIGFYDLLGEEAQKSKEFETGIMQLLAKTNPPPLVQTYLNCVKAANTGEALTRYPGSPAIVRQFLRTEDRMVLSELHDEDYLTLKRAFPHDKKVAIHHVDGYEALKAFLPPKERRGLVLMDPPYEQPDELSIASSALGQAVKRWDTGVYALWYPIKNARALERFHASIQDKIKRPMLCVELCVYPESIETGINGSGMLLVNPPWKLDQEMKEVLPWLWQSLSLQKQGRFAVMTL